MNAAAAVKADEWISIVDAAQLAAVSTGTIYRRIRDGRLTVYERAGRSLLRRSDVAALMVPVAKPHKSKR